jgi:hypothetical protein
VNQVELDRLNAIARAHGFDAFIPTRPYAVKNARRYGLGATCYCRGPDEAPVAMPLDAGQSAVCGLCGTVFHLFEDRSGIGIRHRVSRS